MANLHGQTAKNLKANGKKAKKRVMAFGHRRKEISMRETGKVTSRMGRDCSHMLGGPSTAATIKIS